MTVNPFELVVVTGDDLQSEDELNQLFASWKKANRATELLVQGLISFKHRKATSSNHL